MDTGRYLKAPEPNETAMDKYTASIELSNACRQFYKSRVEAAHCIKSRWERHAHSSTTRNDNDRPTSTDNTSNSSTQQRRQKNSIDEAMDKLRTEMTSLMDQDLSLMKQLLTLNETIEELKWQRRYYYNPNSLPGSSTELDHSDCSLSDTDMYDSEDDILGHPSVPSTVATSTASTTCLTLSSSSVRRKHGVVLESGHVVSAHACSGGSEKRCGVDSVLVSGSAVKVYHGEQDSFDSGIHESSSSGEEEAVV